MSTKHTDGCFHHAEDDEPLFTLLARDPIAPHLVRDWARIGAATGQPQERTDDALQCAAQMEVWMREHRPHKYPLLYPGKDVIAALRVENANLKEQLQAMVDDREWEAQELSPAIGMHPEDELDECVGIRAARIIQRLTASEKELIAENERLKAARHRLECECGASYHVVGDVEGTKPGMSYYVDGKRV